MTSVTWAQQIESARASRANTGLSTASTVGVQTEARRMGLANVRRRAIRQMARALASYGVPSANIARAVVRFATALDVDIYISHTPSQIDLTFDPSFRVEDNKARSSPVPISQGINVNISKIDEVWRIYNEVIESNLLAWQRRKHPDAIRLQCDEEIELTKHPNLSTRTSEDDEAEEDPDAIRTTNPAEDSEEESLDADEARDLEANPPAPDLDVVADKALKALTKLLDAPDRWSRPWRILFAGCACVAVTPFGFGGRVADLGVSFAIGSVKAYISTERRLRPEVGLLLAALWTGLVARMASAITRPGLGPQVEEHVHVFCFSALSQAGLALLLPGYLALDGMTHAFARRFDHMVARFGHVLLVSLCLGFGLMIGIVAANLLAPSRHPHVHRLIRCDPAPDDLPPALRWLFVPVLSTSALRLIAAPWFAFFLGVYNQASARHFIPLVLIAFTASVTQFFVSTHFAGFPPMASIMAAAAGGLAADLYGYATAQPAVTHLFSALWLIVPSGLAANGALASGVRAAEALVNVHGMGSLQGGTSNAKEVVADDDANGYEPPLKGVFMFCLGMVVVSVSVYLGLLVGRTVARCIRWACRQFAWRILGRTLKPARRGLGASYFDYQ